VTTVLTFKYNHYRTSNTTVATITTRTTATAATTRHIAIVIIVVGVVMLYCAAGCRFVYSALELMLVHSLVDTKRN
jgi:hypothetical protein